MAVLSKLAKLFPLTIIHAKKLAIVIAAASVGATGYLMHSYNTFESGQEEIQKSHEPVYIYLPQDEKRVHSDDIGNTYGLTTPDFPEISLKTALCHRLVSMAKSDDYKVKNKAVKELASMFDLEDFQYRTVAQMCDTELAVGLARTSTASLKFFLPPPPFLFVDMKPEEDLKDLYTMLSKSSVLECIQQKTRHAAAVLEAGEELDSFPESAGGFDAHVYYRKQKGPLSHKVHLDALLAHSAISSHRQVMASKKILALLHQIRMHQDDDVKVKSMISQIIGNIALEDNLQDQIFATGWVGILAQWSHSTNISLSLSATRALANMDRHYEGDNIYDDGLYLLYPQFRDENFQAIADVVFVHGIMGGAFRTWRQHDCMNFSHEKEKLNADSNHTIDVQNGNRNYTYCWPKDWLSEEFPYLRLIAVDYASHVTEWKAGYTVHVERRHLKDRSHNMLMKLISAGVGKRPVVFVCHSMGGLLVKQMIVDAASSEQEDIKEVAKNTVGVVFYSVPHMGTEAANFRHGSQVILKPSVEVQELKKGSEQLVRLNEDFKSLADRLHIHCLSFGETLRSNMGLHWSTVLVPPDSANPGFGDFYELRTDHLATCKPLTKSSLNYELVTKFLKQVVPEVPKSDSSVTNTSYSVTDLLMQLFQKKLQKMFGKTHGFMSE